MTIGLQGTWFVSVKSKSASWAQRFVIEGADSGDGTYSGVVATPVVPVTGDQWGVTIENNPTGPITWRPSRARLANFRQEAGFFKVDIESDDGGGFAGDEDFNDLVLTASKPLSESEWIVYGNVKTYGDRCLFNPCFRFPWIVIDTPHQLERLLRYDSMRAILEREYGSGVAEFAKSDNFRPMMLSRGGSNAAGYKVIGNTDTKMTKRGKAKSASLETVTKARLAPADRFDYRSNLTIDDARIIDKLFPAWPCTTDPVGNAIMQFVEYDRSDTELGGGPYEGFGDRENLGVSATDEFGNYVFSFIRTLAQGIDEAAGDTPVGGDPLVAANPDLIIQFPDAPDGVVGYETAPFYDIPTIREINLCIRKSVFAPKACEGGRVMQYIGDIPIVPNPGSNLNLATGTITNDKALAGSGPNVTAAAWRGTIEITGCFVTSQVPVTHYTLEYQVNSEGWEYLNVDLSGLRQQGNGLYVLESYGADQTTLSVGLVPAYRNVELEANWTPEAKQLKARITLKSLLDTVVLPRKIADVRLRIRGYDAAGDLVPGADDEVMLRVDEMPATGDIASILVPGEIDFTGCALIELPSDTSPLEVKLRAIDVDGYLNSWSLSAVKGSNVPVGLTDTATSATPGGAYPGETIDELYVGTPERLSASPDPDGYITISVTPGEGWLGIETFCAFSFELRVQDRTTDGKHAAGSHKVHDEVVGMRAPDMI